MQSESHRSGGSSRRPETTTQEAEPVAVPEHSTTDRLHKTRAPFIKETEWTYEPGRDTITSVTNRVGFHLDQQISQYTYENNADAQRTARTSTQAGNTWTDHFTYDSDTGGITASNPDTEERQPESYQYDKIGNRLEATQGTKTTKYQANALNQYTAISNLPSSISRAPAHDADGNQTHEGSRRYIWDGENRLIAIHEGSSIIAKYTYDHQSRRIARWVHDGTDERYLYNGWNLIAVYQKGQTKPIETYAWGKDLSGTLQGAGGVGGLLFAQIQGAKPNTWIYHYDANGNITQVTDPRGTILEQNTYDAFGKATTTSQIPNRYRFSTKPQDSETGYNYYGYRFYGPDKGRWLSRDPLGEEGGQNVYGFLENQALSAVDWLGLVSFSWVTDGPRYNFDKIYAGIWTNNIQGFLIVEISGGITWAPCPGFGGTASGSESFSPIYTLIPQGDGDPYIVALNIGGVPRSPEPDDYFPNQLSEYVEESFPLCTQGSVAANIIYQEVETNPGGFANVGPGNNTTANFFQNEIQHHAWRASAPPGFAGIGALNVVISWGCDGSFSKSTSPIPGGPNREGRAAWGDLVP